MIRIPPPKPCSGSAPTEVRATPRQTRFSLAANYDPDLVPQLARYPVDEVYGKLPTDGICGGRPRYQATPLSEADLRSYIRVLDQHGIAFNYLLNGACFGNHEWTRHWQKRVTALIDYCLLRCSRMRLTDPSQFIKSAWIRPEDLVVYEAMGYTNFKLLERGIPSAELLRRVKAYSERRFEGNLAELLLSYGFKQPVRKESLWSLRHFWASNWSPFPARGRSHNPR